MNQPGGLAYIALEKEKEAQPEIDRAVGLDWTPLNRRGNPQTEGAAFSGKDHDT